MTPLSTNGIVRLVRRPFGILRAVRRRKVMWETVKRGVEGESEDDERILREAVRNSRKTMWEDLSIWKFPMVNSDCKLRSKGVGTFRVRGGTDDLFHILPQQEPAVENAIRANLRAGEVFVDAGANIGFYTVLASQLVGPSGRVYSFEMIPDTADILRDHVSLNQLGNVTVIEGALSEKSGDRVEASVYEGRSGQASIAVHEGQSTIAVETVTLGEAIATEADIALIKMDLEGAELGALRGLGEKLSAVRAIVFENRGNSEVVSFLEDRGFAVSRLDPNNLIGKRRA